MLQAVPKPERKTKEPKRLQTKTRMKAKNPKRAAKMRARNFPDRDGSERCLIAVKLEDGRLRSGWSRCRGPIDPAHVVHARGMGGCNSSKDEVVWLCRGHHDEQEGRTRAFELRYGVDLKAEAARRASGTPSPDSGAPC
jgi:hypothetical protein